MQAKANVKGYISVTLQTEIGPKRFYAHRLVAEAFIRKIEKGEVVNHLNFCKTDNRLQNLEIVTYKQNSEHAKAGGRYANNGRNSPRGEAARTAKLDREKVVMLRQEHEHGDNYQTLAKRYGVTRTQVMNVVKRNSWAHV